MSFSNNFAKMWWIKDLTSSQTFPIFLLVEVIRAKQLHKCNIKSNFNQGLATWCDILLKKIKHERNFGLNHFLSFIWWIPNLKWSCKIQRYLFKDKMNQRAYLLPNVSNSLVNGTDKRAKQLQKCNIISNFRQNLARCYNFPIKKQRTKRAPSWTNF